MEGKQGAPSVIAKLMGLDELAPQQSIQKQRRVLSENYLKRVASIGVRGKRVSHERQSFWMDIDKQLEIKDVKDRFHTPSVENNRANLSSSESKEQLTRQKLDVRYGKHQPSKGFHDCLEIIDSPNYLLKYVEESDSLYTKLINDLQGVPLHSQCWNTTVLNSSCAYDHRNIDKYGKSGRTAEKGHTKSLQKLVDFLVADSNKEHGVDNLHQFSRCNMELKESPSRIVVLKPKLRKTENASRYISSPISCEGTCSGEKIEECLSFGRGNCSVEVKGKKKLARKPESIRQSFKFSRDITKETFRNNTRDKSIAFAELPRSKLKGASDPSVKDSALIVRSSPNISLLNKKDRSLISSVDGKFTVREAKNRISERWKTTQNFQELGLGERGVTLAEMLAMPDYEIRSRKLDSKLFKHGPSNQIGFDDVNVTVGSPLYIGSGDDGKDGLVAENNHLVQDKLTTELENTNLSQPDYVVPESSVSTVACGSLVADVMTNTKTGVKRKELQDELAACILLVKEAYSFSDISDSSIQQDISLGIPKEGTVSSCCSGTDPKSFVSLKEDHQPCPDSVLEPPFKDGFSSSSESSESFDPDLHSKSSESTSEGPGMFVSSDEDTGEESMCQSEEYFTQLFRDEESRDFSYLVDILTEADVHGKKLDMGFDTLQTPQLQISHLVFETLEKKYNEQIYWKRSERRLLFDRINSGLTEILNLYTGVSSWAKPGSIRFNLRLSWVVTEKELWTLLVRQEKEEANKDSFDKVMGGGFGWLELGEDIEEIGRDIERVLIDELVAEIASSGSF